jgi:WD40 repeat protein
MADVFISYAREDKAFVRRIHEALAARSLEAWVDWEDIPPTADYIQEIHAAIEAADAVVLVLSPDWAASTICAQEASHALAHNKRLAPIVFRDTEPERLPPAVAALNWIFARETDSFPDAFEALVSAIQTDLPRTRAITRLLVRAIEWDAKQRDPSFLLRGVDLEQAERTVTAGESAHPRPTPLQREYVLASRLDAVKRQRRTLGVLAAGLVIAIVLAALAFWQYRVAEQRRIAEQTARLDAERKTRIATSQRLAAQADGALLRYPQRSLLLAVEAVRIALNSNEPIAADAEQALRRALAAASGRGLGGPGANVLSIALSADSRSLAAGGQDAVYLWDIAEPSLAAPIVLGGVADDVRSVTFAGNDRWLVALTAKKQPLAWSLEGAQPVAKRFEVPPQLGVIVANLGVDGRRLLAIAQDGTLVLWDLTSATPTANPRMFRPPAPLEPLEVVEAVTRTTADGRWLAYKLLGRPVQLWDLRTDNPAGQPRILEGSDALVPALAISPDERWLVESGDDHAVRLWDLSAPDPSASPSGVFKGHDDEITAVTFSRDGRWLVTGSMDRTARVWDLNAGRRPAASIVLRGHREMVRALGISDDGRWVISSSVVNSLDPERLLDTTAWLWDLRASGAPKAFPLAGHEQGVTAATITGDGKRAITGSRGGQIRLWNLEGEDPTARPLVLRGHDGGIYTTTLSRDGRWLAAHGTDLGVRVWNLRAPQASGLPIVLADDGRGSLHISPDSRWLALGGALGADGRLWDLRVPDPASGALTLTNVRKGSTSGVDPFVFSPDARWMLASGDYAESRLFDLSSPKLTDASRPLDKGGGPVQVAAFSADSRWLMMVREYTKSQVRLWDLRAPELDPIVLGGDANPVSSVKMSPDSRWLAVADSDGGVDLWDLQSPVWSAAPVRLTGDAKGSVGLEFSPDGRRLVTTGRDGTFQVWDVSAAKTPRPIRFEVGKTVVFDARFSPDGRWLVTSGGDDQPARLWDLHATRPEASARIFPGARIRAEQVSFSPDGRWIVTVDTEMLPCAWDLRAPALLERPFVLGGPGYRARFVTITPDSRWVATTGAADPIALKDPVVRLFDLNAVDPSKATINLLGHERGVSALAMTADGSVLISGGTDSTVRHWNLRSNAASDTAIVISGQQGGINQIVASPDGRWIASRAEDVRVWPLNGADLVSPARHAAGRNFTLDEWALFFPGQPYRRTFIELPAAVAPRDR